MKIKVTNGRVTFNGDEFKNLNLDLQFQSDELMSKVDNDYTLQELITMTKEKAKSMDIVIDFVTEKRL